MIQIFQNQKNQVTVTVSELSETGTNLFLWEIINQESKQSFYCLTCNSSSLNRYDQFCLTSVTGSPNSSSGEIYIPFPGQYSYAIYENPSGSFSPVGLNKVESGKLYVATSSYSPVAFTGSINQYIIYNG